MIQSIGFQKLVFALLLICIVPATTRAQSDTEYKFRQQAVVNGASYGGAPTTILSMDCLTADGYGQWITSLGSGFPECCLLGNGLYKPSTSWKATDTALYPGCIPPGIVDYAFMSDLDSKPHATSNLDGSVFFAATDASTISLYLFDTSNIDITLDSIPNDSETRKIIRNFMKSYKELTKTGSDTTHNILPQADYRDEFSFCADAHYLYMAWASNDHSRVPGDTDIWGMIYNIATDTFYSPMYLGSGYRPGIACIKRQNRVGIPVQQFDLAYLKTDPITGWPNLVSVIYNNGVIDTNKLVPKFHSLIGGLPVLFTNVMHVCPLISDVVGQIQPTHAIYATVQTGLPAPTGHKQMIEYVFQTPTTSANDTAYYVDGEYISHALPVPAPGLGQLPPYIYDQHITGFTNAYDAQNYVTGTPFDQFHCIYQLDIVTTPAPGPPTIHSYPLMIIRGHDNGYLSTTDTRLVLNQNAFGVLEPNPDNNWYVGAINQMGIHVHWFSTDTIAGITTHYYSRDTSRAFDEPIDENTLVTDRCTVKDGRAHGGTLGAELENGKEMTVWTDPNYGANDSVPVPGSKAYGLYQPWDSTTLNLYVGTLNFEGDSTQLVIGDSDNWTSTPATLAAMPFFYFNFLGSDQSVAVHGIFDYYGLNATHNSNHSNRFLMTPFTDGTADYLGAGTIYIGKWVYGPPGADTLLVWDPVVENGTLNVHGGADFFIGPKGRLVTNYGNINCKYEPNLYPINVATGDTNADATGHVTILGQAELRSGNITGNIPADTSVPGGPSAIIMSIDTGYRTYFTGGDPFQVHAVNVGFSNQNPLATSIIQFGHFLDSTSSFWNVKLDSSEFTAINLHMIDPDTLCNFTISNSLFNQMHRRTITCERDFLSTAPPFYDSITIDNNNFTSIEPNWADDSIIGTVDIYLKNFNVTRSGDLPKTITVSGNHFTDTANWDEIYPIHHDIAGYYVNQDVYSAAILFQNTTGNIITDTVTDNSYFYGIELAGTLEHLEPVVFKTNTFLCSDYLAHLRPPNWYFGLEGLFYVPFALYTSYYDGYVKLTTISDCIRPYYASGDGHSNLVFDTIDARNPADTTYHYYYIDPPVYVEASASNIVDLSGIHGGSNDVAGFNNIRGYRGAPLLQMGTSGSLANLGNSLDTGGDPFFNYGENNIFTDSIIPLSNTAYLIGINYPSLSVNVGNIDHDFWGTGINPASGTGTCAVNCHWSSLDTAELTAENITYDIPDSTRDSLISPPFELTCGDSRAVEKKKGEQPQNIQQPDTTSRCQILFNKILVYDQNADWQLEYDTCKYLIENYPCCSWTPGAFNDMSDAVGHLSGNSNDCNLWNVYNKWLDSVLYLCTFEEYFCACIQEMSVVYCPDNTGPTGDSTTDAKLAILQWVIQNDTPCANQGQLQGEFNSARNDQIQQWKNDSAQGIHYPLDTTLPTLKSLGLDTLFAKHFLYASVSPGAAPVGILSNASASPNPTTSGVVIYFSIAKEAYVKINLYDVLGHEVGSTAFESLFEPGNYDIPISLQNLPSGTYFARITTAFGEAETVKLVKE